MADIELVIKIPEEAYKRRKRGDISPWITDAILDAVANGKPLDEVLDEIKAEIKTNKEKWWYGVNDDCFMKLSDVLSIIDKYKEEKDKE